MKDKNWNFKGDGSRWSIEQVEYRLGYLLKNGKRCTNCVEQMHIVKQGFESNVRADREGRGAPND
jgi:hypothetical protein